MLKTQAHGSHLYTGPLHNLAIGFSHHRHKNYAGNPELHRLATSPSYMTTTLDPKPEIKIKDHTRCDAHPSAVARRWQKHTVGGKLTPQSCMIIMGRSKTHYLLSRFGEECQSSA